MKEGEIYAGGLRLNFFDSPDFEQEDSEDAQRNALIIARNALRLLMMGWNENWKQLKSWRVFNAVFVKRDPELLRGMRQAFQEGFNHLFTQLNNEERSKEQHRQAKLYISNCMTYLPFSDLNPYESIAIPQYINDRWRMVEYKITPIELTPTKGFSKLFIEDEDRVFAYGLSPRGDTEARPHLIFMGTTYPAGQGFTTQINADLEAFASPGHSLYTTGRAKIMRWLDEQEKLGRLKPHVCGTSLGGILALMLAMDQGHRLDRIDALNPPGPYEPLLFTNPYNNWSRLEPKPKVLVQKQNNDPVSCFGTWQDDWTILNVTPPEPEKYNAIKDHALNYAGNEETKFEVADTIKDNQERKTRNFWLYTLLRGFAYYCVHQPYRLLVLPTLRYALNHKLLLTLVALYIVASVFVPALIPAVPVSLFVVVGLLAVGAYLMYKLNIAMKVLFGENEIQAAPCHEANCPRNEATDLYRQVETAAFSKKDLATYYLAKYVVLKGYREVPENKISRIRDDSITKSKAKIDFMRHTIFLSNSRSRSDLREELIEQHELYSQGKPSAMTV